MGTAAAIRAGRAFVEIFVDATKAERGLRAIESRFRNWGKSLGNLGSKAFGGPLPEPLNWVTQFATSPAGIVAGFLAAANSLRGMGDELDAMSVRTGMAIESLSALSYAAEIGNLSMEEFEANIKKMHKAIAAAAEGEKSATEALAALGISIQDLDGLSPEEQFFRMADGLAGIANPSQRAAAAMAIFGKGATKMLPMLADGADGIKQLMEHARQMGWVMSAEDARAAAAFDDAIVGLNRSMGAIVRTVGASILPTLMRWAQQLVALGRYVRDLLQNNSDLLRTIFSVAAAVTIGGVAFSALAVILPAVGSMFGAMAAAVSALGSVLAFIATPMGLIITLAAAAGVALVNFSKAGAAAWDWLKIKASMAWTDLKRMFAGLGDALVAGRWDLAVKVLWTGIKLQFWEGVRSVQEAWEGLKGLAIDTVLGTMAGAAKMMVGLWGEVQKGFASLMAAIEKMWNSMIARIVNGLNSALGSAMVSAGESLQSVWGMEGVGKSLASEGRMLKGRAASNAADTNRQVDKQLEGQIERIDTTTATRQSDIDDWAKGKAEAWRKSLAGKPWVSDEEMEKLVSEFEAALAEASKAAANLAPGTNLPGGRPAPDFEGLTQKTSIFGTFSGEALWGLGAAGDPLLDEAKAQNKRLESIDQKLGEGNETQNAILEAARAGVLFA